MADLVDSSAAATAAARIAGEILGTNTHPTLSYNSPPQSAVVASSLNRAAPGAPRATRAGIISRMRRGSSSLPPRLGYAAANEWLVVDDDHEWLNDDEWVADDDVSIGGDSFEDENSAEDDSLEEEDVEDIRHSAASSLGFAYRRGQSLSVGLLRRHAELVAELVAVGRPAQPRQRHYDDPSVTDLAHRRARQDKEHPHADEIKKKFPSMVCPITHEVFRDPVVASDGHTYERIAIERWLEAHNTSPVTNEALRGRTLHENVLARNVITESTRSHETAAATLLSEA